MLHYLDPLSLRDSADHPPLVLGHVQSTTPVRAMCQFVLNLALCWVTKVTLGLHYASHFERDALDILFIKLLALAAQMM